MKYIILGNGISINKEFETASEAFTFGKGLNVNFAVHEKDMGVIDLKPVIIAECDKGLSTSGPEYLAG